MAPRAEIPEELLEFAQRLRDAMKAEKIKTRKALAKLAKLSPQVVSRALKGHERLAGMQANTVIKLAGALGVRAGWLLVGEPPMRPSSVLSAENQTAAAVVRETLRQIGYQAPGLEMAKDEVPGPSERPNQVLPGD